MQAKYNTAQDLEQVSLSPIELINAIHRSPSAYCVLMQKNPIVHHGAIPGMSKTFPEQLEFSADAYFSVNSYGVTGRGIMSSTGLHYGLRAEKYLSHLNALYVDFDTGRGDGIAWEDVAIELLKLQRDKKIPAFTMIAGSGRGCYAVWLLHDPKTGEGIPATPQNVMRYKALHKSLHTLMPKWLKPDPKAIDATRILRLSQTLNSTANRPCQWFMVSNARYTLNEIDVYLRTGKPPQLELLPDYQAPPEGLRPIVERDMYPARRNGYLAVNSMRLHDLELIEQFRGGFLHGGWEYEDGHRSPGRRFLLSLYCQYSYAVGTLPVDIKRKVRDMAARCTPPYPSDVSDVPLRNIFQGIFSKDKDAFYKNLKTEAFHKLLGVDRLPASLHGRLKTVKPCNPPTPPKKARIQARRDAIRRILREHTPAPSSGELASMMHAEGIHKQDGAPWDKKTIQRDLKTMG